jgi:hypothetical protein
LLVFQFSVGHCENLTFVPFSFKSADNPPNRHHQERISVEVCLLASTTLSRRLATQRSMAVGSGDRSCSGRSPGRWAGASWRRWALLV